MLVHVYYKHDPDDDYAAKEDVDFEGECDGTVNTDTMMANVNDGADDRTVHPEWVHEVGFCGPGTCNREAH